MKSTFMISIKIFLLLSASIHSMDVHAYGRTSLETEDEVIRFGFVIIYLGDPIFLPLKSYTYDSNLGVPKFTDFKNHDFDLPFWLLSVKRTIGKPYLTNSEQYINELYENKWTIEERTVKISFMKCTFFKEFRSKETVNTLKKHNARMYLKLNGYKYKLRINLEVYNVVDLTFP